MEYPIFYIRLEQYIVGKLGYIPQLFTRYFCNLSYTEAFPIGNPRYIENIENILRKSICQSVLRTNLASKKKRWQDFKNIKT